MDTAEVLIEESRDLLTLAEQVQDEELPLDEQARKEKLSELSSLYHDWYRRGLALLARFGDPELRESFEQEYSPPGFLSFPKIQRFLTVGWKTHRTANWVAKFQSAFKEPLENQCNLLAILSAGPPASASDREEQHAVGDLARILARFRECCQYLQEPPKGEREVQDIVWIMLRSHFDRVDREDTLPRFGVKSYKPDFGVPDLRVLVEVKFVGEKTNVGEDIQEGILADVPGYLSQQSAYDSIIVFVYDAAHKLRDPRKFVEDLQSVAGIAEVIVVPGVG